MRLAAEGFALSEQVLGGCWKVGAMITSGGGRCRISRSESKSRQSMNNLSCQEKCFFCELHNWGFGPMYEVWMYFRRGSNLDRVEALVFDYDRLLRWDGVGPQSRKSILFIDGLPSVGLVHCKEEERPIPGEPNMKSFPAYSLAIYPPQYERCLGKSIHHPDSDNVELWHLMEPWRVRRFHEALFGLIAYVSRYEVLLSSSINTEDRGMALPYAFDGSVCLSPALPEILGVQSRPLEYAYDYFVATDFPLATLV
jgi:hypothetical protein